MNLGFIKHERVKVELKNKQMNYTGNYIADSIDDSENFTEEPETEFIDCELCGDAFLIENAESLTLMDKGEVLKYTCVCPECVKLHK